MSEETTEHISYLMVNLLKGVVHREDNLQRWEQMLDLQAQLHDYLALLNLELHLHEEEGYAFLRNREQDPEGPQLPKLVARHQLSYPVSLILAQLRRKLAEHDAMSGEERLIVEQQEIVDMMGTFFPTGTNEAGFTRKVVSWLQKVKELGFIRYLDTGAKEQIEVRRIIKSFVDAQWLNEFDQRIREYREYGGAEDA